MSREIKLTSTVTTWTFHMADGKDVVLRSDTPYRVMAGSPTHNYHAPHADPGFSLLGRDLYIVGLNTTGLEQDRNKFPITMDTDPGKPYGSWFEAHPFDLVPTIKR